MKKRLTIGLITMGMVAILVAGQVKMVKAQQGVELNEVSVITAKVVAIDRVDRHVTLRGPEGNDVTVEVDHAARNFDQIEIGDQVKVEYYESVALYLGKHGEKPDATAGHIVARAAKGEKPAGVAVETVDVAATVQEIDFKGQKIKTQDWALAALAVLARKNRVISMEMLKAALGIRFQKTILESAMELVDRVVG